MKVGIIGDEMKTTFFGSDVHSSRDVHSRSVVFWCRKLCARGYECFIKNVKWLDKNYVLKEKMPQELSRTDRESGW